MGTLLALALALATLVSSCGGGPTPSPPPDASDVPLASASGAIPSDGPSSAEPTAPSVSPSADDPRVAFAAADLATRYGYAPDDIAVVGVEPVTWPNAGLGCPAADRSYDPTPVPGYRVVLQVGERTYRYHGADGSDEPRLCLFLD